MTKFNRIEAGHYVTEIDGDTFIVFRSEYPCIGGTYWGIARRYANGDYTVVVDRRTEIPGFRYLADAKAYVTEILEAA